MKSLALFLILVMFWAVGLLAFTARIERSTPAAEPQAADAIVALTGNATVRITTAVKLLEQGTNAGGASQPLLPHLRPGMGARPSKGFSITNFIDLVK